jgi:hypothetical protein
MDSVVLVDSQGNAFRLEPPNEKMSQIIESNLDIRSDEFFDIFHATKLNRVSNCSWCFWSITADFEIKLFVYKTAFPIQVVVSSYENKVKLIFGACAFCEMTAHKLCLLCELFLRTSACRFSSVSKLFFFKS